MAKTKRRQRRSRMTRRRKLRGGNNNNNAAQGNTSKYNNTNSEEYPTNSNNNNDEMRKHMTNLDNAIRNGKKEKALDMISEMNESFFDGKHRYWTGREWLLYTPLMHAAEVGDKDLVEALLRRGANIHLEDGDYETAVDKAPEGELKTTLMEIQEKTQPGMNKNAYTKIIRNILNRPQASQGNNTGAEIQGESGSALGAGAGR